MKIKKEYLILLLVIGALCAYLVTRTKDKTHFELPQIAEVDSQKINRLEISKGGNTIELNKKDDQWTIGSKEYIADSIKVKNMVNTVTDLKITALVSESGKYDRYDLTDDKKVEVRAFGGKDILRNFVIGRQAPTYQHTFVKLTENPKVYHARGNINATFKHTVGELRDQTVLEYQKDDIAEITLSKGDQTLTLFKKEITPKKEASSDEKKEKQPKPVIQWQDSKENKVIKADVDLLIEDFAKLKCDGYLEDDAKDGLKDPLWTILLKSDKENHLFSIFQKKKQDSEKFPASSSGTPYAFVLNKSRVETFDKHLDKLLKPKTEKPETEKNKK